MRKNDNNNTLYGAIYFNSTFQNIESSHGSHVDPRDSNKLYKLNVW